MRIDTHPLMTFAERLQASRARLAQAGQQLQSSIRNAVKPSTDSIDEFRQRIQGISKGDFFTNAKR